jgi:hypothetical protein
MVMGSKWLLRRPLSLQEILAWGEAHRQATGTWPTKESDSIVGAKFETWLTRDSIPATACRRHKASVLCPARRL